MNGAPGHGVRPARLRASGQSLSARLVWLTIGAVLLTEALVFLPNLGRTRRTWLSLHAMQGNIVALSLAGAADGTVTQATREGMLRLAGAEMIRLTAAGGAPMTLSIAGSVQPASRVDLRTETIAASVIGALADIVAVGDRPLLILAASPWLADATIEVVVHEAALSDDLRVYASSIIGPSLIVAGVVGALIYLSLLIFLVRPMRRITDSIVAFRADPERAAPLDATHLTRLPHDEIALAGQELAAMQRELRTALWRNARLAALGTAVAKVSHDLRGILSPALLTADRLEASADPSVRRAGEVVASSVQRAIDLVRRALDFTRDGPPPLTLSRIALARLVQDVGSFLPQGTGALSIDNRVDAGIEVVADRDQLSRVLSNLLRNAAEAEASRAWVCATVLNATGTTLIDVGDNGPGLSTAARHALFRPFNASGRPGSSGLGLAIARDLMRAHGGDIDVLSSGPDGSVFRLTLPAAELPPDPSVPAAS